MARHRIPGKAETVLRPVFERYTAGCKFFRKRFSAGVKHMERHEV